MEPSQVVNPRSMTRKIPGRPLVFWGGSKNLRGVSWTTMLGNQLRHSKFFSVPQGTPALLAGRFLQAPSIYRLRHAVTGGHASPSDGAGRVFPEAPAGTRGSPATRGAQGGGCTPGVGGPSHSLLMPGTSQSGDRFNSENPSMDRPLTGNSKAPGNPVT